MGPTDEIRNLLGLYCERIDLGDFDGVGALFEHGALTDEHGNELARGRDAVARFYRVGTRLHGGSPRTKHVVADSVIDLDDAAGTAVVHSSYVVWQQTERLPLQAIIAGRYHDTFSRAGSDGRWHFSERRFLVDLVGDLRDHLAYDIR